MPVNVGHDYHLAEVERYATLGVYRAECAACGWHGPDRDTKRAADDDATAHDIASNPPSNRETRPL